MPDTFFYYLFSSIHSKNSSSLWLIVYVLCFKVRPLFDKTYKYSESEYAQILTLRLKTATFFRVICRFIFESFLSRFSASFTYPKLALKSREIISSLFVLQYLSWSGALEILDYQYSRLPARHLRHCSSTPKIAYKANAAELNYQCHTLFFRLSSCKVL